MKCPRWLYRWVDQRNSIPVVVRWLWPSAHWCSEMDDLLCIGAKDDNCCCERRTLPYPVPKDVTTWGRK